PKRVIVCWTTVYQSRGGKPANSGPVLSKFWVSRFYWSNPQGRRSVEVPVEEVPVEDWIDRSAPKIVDDYGVREDFAAMGVPGTNIVSQMLTANHLRTLCAGVAEDHEQ